MTWGTKLIQQRKKAKFSTTELADLLGVSHGTIHNWESDKTRMSAENLPKLAEVLKCDFTDLIPDNTTVKILSNTQQTNHDNTVAIVGFEVTVDTKDFYKDLVSSKDQLIEILKEQVMFLKAEIVKLKA